MNPKSFHIAYHLLPTPKAVEYVERMDVQELHRMDYRPDVCFDCNMRQSEHGVYCMQCANIRALTALL